MATYCEGKECKLSAGSLKNDHLNDTEILVIIVKNNKIIKK